MKRRCIPYDKADKGFSLIELSIVLVILGLLVGGVLGGQALIRAAELRAVTNEMHEWQTAANTFRLQYNAYPGDMLRAEDFWPGQTANGNGDGYVAFDGSTPREAFLFWQHLALAGLISGEYTGVNGGAAMWHHVPDQNCPESRIRRAGWTARYWDNEPENSARVFRVNYGHGLMVGRPGTISGGNMNYDGFITPQDAWNIDTKYDDGRPARGHIHGVRPDMPCSSAIDNEDLDAEYSLTETGEHCALFFLNVF